MISNNSIEYDDHTPLLHCMAATHFTSSIAVFVYSLSSAVWLDVWWRECKVIDWQVGCHPLNYLHHKNHKMSLFTCILPENNNTGAQCAPLCLWGAHRWISDKPDCLFCVFKPLSGIQTKANSCIKTAIIFITCCHPLTQPSEIRCSHVLLLICFNKPPAEASLWEKDANAATQPDIYIIFATIDLCLTTPLNKGVHIQIGIHRVVPR